MALQFQNYNFIGDNFAIGGINLDSAVTNVKDNEASDCKNVVFSTAGSVVKRQGYSKLNMIQITEAGVPQSVTGIYQLQQSSGASCVITGAGTNIYHGIAALVSVKTGQTAGALYDFSALNDFAFIVNGVDPNLKDDCTTITGLGIDPPAVAPTFNANIAGVNLTFPANYKYVVTFVSSYAAESNPSPQSAVIPTIAVTQDLRINIPISTDPQVTSRNIYRTFPSGEIFLFVGSVADNVTTTFDDHIPDLGLGVEVEADNDKPPVMKYIETHKNRLFGIDASVPSRLIFSKAFRPESFPGLNFIDISPDDGDLITGIVSFFDQLVIFKRESIYILSGSDETDFTIQRAQTDNRVGAVSNRSIVVLDNVVAFLAERGVYAFDGLRTAYISQALEGIFDKNNSNQFRRFNWSQEEITVASNYKNSSRNWYFLCVPTGSSLQNDLVMVYDYVVKNWTLFTGIFANALAIVEESNEPRLYSGSYDGFLYKQDDTDNDGFIHTPAFSTGGNGLLTLNDTTQAWPVNGLIGVRVKILSGPGEDQIRTIVSNTATQLTISSNWSTIPTILSEYSVGFIDSEWQSRWFHYNQPEFFKRLMYAQINTSREGNYNLDVIFRFDFNEDDTVIRALPLSGIGSLWDVDFWDVAIWDQINTIITRLTNDGNKIHRYVKVIFRNEGGNQPYSVNSFNYVWQLKGVRH